jgi:nucleoside-diphosphate-sugar epimerase
MPILVTGAAGFVGASLCKRLSTLGEDVVAFDAARDTTLLDLVVTQAQRTRIRLETGDLLDLPLLLRICRQHGVDGIIHLAYLSTKLTKANPGYAQKVNVEGTNNVFELVLDQGISRFVWASTIDVFGPKSVSADGIVVNDAPYDPQSIYGACKALNEVAARDYAKAFGLKAAALRIPAAFGPGVTNSWVRFIPQMIKDLVEGDSAEAPKLNKVMPWLYVEDIADAFIKALDVTDRSDAHGYTLPGAEIGTDRVVDMIRRLFPSKTIEYIDWPDLGTVPTYDCTAVQSLLDWRPAFGVEDGLVRIANYYRGALDGSGPPA